MVGDSLEGKSPTVFQVCIGMSWYIEIREHHLMVEILLNLEVYFFQVSS